MATNWRVGYRPILTEGQQDLGEDFQFSPDQTALESILSLEGVSRGSLAPPAAGLAMEKSSSAVHTPANEVPDSLKNTQLDFFENKNGQVFFRRKITESKSPAGMGSTSAKRGFGRVPNLFEPRRMNMKRGPLVTTLTPLASKENCAMRSTTVVKQCEGTRKAAATLYRQSLSEQKVPPFSSRGFSGIPIPKQPSKVPARKALQFTRPLPVVDNGGRRSLKLERQEPAFSNSTDRDVIPSLTRDTLMQSSLTRLTRQSMRALPRESLAWMSQLPRDSITFAELQKMMNDEEQQIVNEDDTSSFEAMENRMKTPKKAKEPGSSFSCKQEDKENIMRASLSGVSHSQDKSITLQPCSQLSQLRKAECTKPPAPDDAIHSPSSRTSLKCETHSMSWLSPALATKSVSMTQLPLAPGLTEQPLQVSKSASLLSLHEGSNVALSDLVPADEVSLVVGDLGDSLQQVQVYREQQDQLVRQWEQLMIQVTQRKQRFRELWGVSPLKIKTKRTILPSRPSVAKKEQNEIVIKNSTECKGVEEVPSDIHVNDTKLNKTTDLEPPQGTKNKLTKGDPGCKDTLTNDTGRKVRFNSGNNHTRTFSPLVEEHTDDLYPLAFNLKQSGMAANNQSFASLKSDFSFLQTPRHPVPRPTAPVQRLPTGVGATPAALRCLKSKVETAFAVLYADSDQSGMSCQPSRLQF